MSHAFNPDYQKSDVPPDQRLRLHLDGDEKIIWAGKPIASGLFARSLVILIFAVPWLAFSLFWEFMALAPLMFWSDNAIGSVEKVFALIFPLFGLPFVIIGFKMVAKPFAIKTEAERAIYAVTTKRAIVFLSGKNERLLSFPFDTASFSMEVEEKKDGSGSLFFRSERSIDKKDKKGWVAHLRGFECVADVREAEKAVVRARSYTPQMAPAPAPQETKTYSQAGYLDLS